MNAPHGKHAAPYSEHIVERPSSTARHATYYCAACDYDGAIAEQLAAHTPTHRADVEHVATR
jgi:hypothetical protein